MDPIRRINNLRLLKAGWLNGEGVAVDKTLLDWLVNEINQYCPYTLKYPYIYPTPEGGVQLVWDGVEVEMEPGKDTCSMSFTEGGELRDMEYYKQGIFSFVKDVIVGYETLNVEKS